MSRGAVQLITLIIIELVRINLVWKLEYLNIYLRTDNLQLTFDIMELTVQILLNPELQIPNIRIFIDCSIIYLLAWSFIFVVNCLRFGLVIIRSLLLSELIKSLYMLQNSSSIENQRLMYNWISLVLVLAIIIVESSTY